MWSRTRSPGFETILVKELENAFPSQHAAGTFAGIWPVLYLGRRRLAAVLGTGAVLTGIGRVYTGLHFPIDIVGGLLVSVAAFSITCKVKPYLIELIQKVRTRFSLED